MKLAALLLLLVPTDTHADVFAQVGTTGSVQSLTVGATREWDWRRESRYTLTGYNEVSIGTWGLNHIQVGIKPTLRASAGQWFIEAGIGANLIVPKYERFSTAFQFGDHVGIGYGPVMLRFEHFSNGSIKRPNPGENFLQLRYSTRL